MLRFFAWGIALCFTGAIIASVAAIIIVHHYNKDLPDYSQLEKYDPPIVSRLYAGDGRLMAEYATEKRIYVPLSAIPKRVIHAFVAAEDKNFYSHTGVDIRGIGRAVITNLANLGQGKSLVGGSTITQQVVKNFLLTNEKSFERKIKEAILATKISQVFSKDRILELYLNEIYLGAGSYGVAAAALNYFNKSLDELSVEEAAMLAALPKAPANYNPRRNYEAAKNRRDYVITRMLEDKYISDDDATTAIAAPITLRTRDATETVEADFFSEEVRRKLVEMYGSNVLYEGGLSVKTTLDPNLQKIADHALRKALIEYDRRRGFRGPVEHFATMENWQEKIAKMKEDKAVPLIDDQQLAIVTGLEKSRAKISFANGDGGVIPQKLLKWTRRVVSDGVLGPAVNEPGDILKVGDVVIVGPLDEDEIKKLPEAERKLAWDLQQVPLVNGALVAIDPHTGRVLALTGGYSYGGTEFNRATQAYRQPGSSIKPFVYLAGLESGLTPSTLLLDAPVELSQGAGLPTWKPQNYSAEYLGLATMRVGLEKSRNTMTVRIAQIIGIKKVLAVLRRLGIYDDIPRNFSVVLGAMETTPLRLTNAYCMLVNGGKKVHASLIERIDDRHGRIIFRRDSRQCDGCKLDIPPEQENAKLADAQPPMLLDDRPQVIDPRVAYQMVSMLQGVVRRGTGAKASSLGKVLAGKTGTTNDSIDTWFVGFSPDLAVGVFVGFDKPRTLGRKETGSSVALPGWMEFMKLALKDKPNVPFRIPRGIRLMKVDLYTGYPVDMAGPGSKVITEAFVSGGPVWVPANEVQAHVDIATEAVPQMDGEAVDGVAPDSTAMPELPPSYNPMIMPVDPTPSRSPVVGTGGLY